MDASSLVTKDIADGDLPPLQDLLDVVDHLVTKDIADDDLPPLQDLLGVVDRPPRRDVALVVTLPLL